MKQKQIKSMVYIFEGKAVIPQHFFDYCIFDTSTAYIRLHNVSQILSDIYYRDEEQSVRVKILKYDKRNNQYDLLFEESGVLYLDKSEGVYDWFVNGQDLGKVLFYNTDSHIKVEIEDIQYSKYVIDM